MLNMGGQYHVLQTELLHLRAHDGFYRVINAFMHPTSSVRCLVAIDVKLILFQPLRKISRICNREINSNNWECNIERAEMPAIKEALRLMRDDNKPPA